MIQGEKAKIFGEEAKLLEVALLLIATSSAFYCGFVRFSRTSHLKRKQTAISVQARSFKTTKFEIVLRRFARDVFMNP